MTLSGVMDRRGWLLATAATAVGLVSGVASAA